VFGFIQGISISRGPRLTWEGCAQRLGREVGQHVGEGDAQGAPAVGTGEPAEGRGRRAQRMLPIGRPLLLGQKRRLHHLDLGQLCLTPPIHGGQKFPVHASVSQQIGGGVGTVGETRVVLLLEALSRTAAESVASHPVQLAASGGAVGVGGRVDVRVVRGWRAVAVVRRRGAQRRLSGRGIAAQRRVAGQDGVLGPGLARGGTWK